MQTKGTPKKPGMTKLVLGVLITAHGWISSANVSSTISCDLGLGRLAHPEKVFRAIGRVKNGVSKDQLMGRLKTDDLGWQLSFTPAPIDHIYSELSQTERRQSVVSSANTQRPLSQPSGWQVQKLANPNEQLKQISKEP